MVERQFGYPYLQRKIILDVARSGSNRKFSDAQAYRVYRTVAGSMLRAILSVQLATAAVSHVLKKTSASIARYHSSKCSCGYTGDRVCKEVQELVTLIVLLPPPSPTVPRHDRPSQKRWQVNCLCVPFACDERVSRVTGCM